MSSDTTAACPECDTARIDRNGGEHTKPYGCKECGHRFTEPVIRPTRPNVGTDPRGGLAQRLADADPEEVSR